MIHVATSYSTGFVQAGSTTFVSVHTQPVSFCGSGQGAGGGWGGGKKPDRRLGPSSQLRLLDPSQVKHKLLECPITTDLFEKNGYDFNDRNNARDMLYKY